MIKICAILLLYVFAASCSSPVPGGRIDDLLSCADSISDPLERHLALTRRLDNERSLYEKYRIASENIAFFTEKKMPLELGRNYEALGDAMAQLNDLPRALEYYERAASCFRDAASLRDLYKYEMHRTNALPSDEAALMFGRLLADTAVTNDSVLHAMALKGAYIATDSTAYLDSCLSLLDRSPSAACSDLPLLLALKADQMRASGSLHVALGMIPRIRNAMTVYPPIAPHREFIHAAVSEIYYDAGMKDSCISELSQVIWWTDSAYREAQFPEIYASETRKLIDMTEKNARLARRNVMLWWAVSAFALLSLCIWIYFHFKRRQALARQEIEMLDSRIEELLRSHTADDVMIDPRFASRLKADFPDLSEGQLRLASLIAAGVDSSRLATLLSISSKSLYTGRYRLRAALGIAKADSLEDFLRRYLTS